MHSLWLLALAVPLLFYLYRYLAKYRRTHSSQAEVVDLTLLLANAPVPLLMVNQQGNIEATNSLASNLCGFTEAELRGMHVDELLPERYRGMHKHFREQYQRQPHTRQMGKGQDLFLLRKDGRELPVEIGLGPLPAHKQQRVLVSLIDLSDRRNAEARMRMAVEASPIAIVICDQLGTIQMVNKQAEDLFGYFRSALLGQSVEILLPEAMHDQHVLHRQGYVAKPSARPMGEGRELFARHQNGQHIPVEVALAPFHVGNVTLVQAAVVDISVRRANQAALQEYSEKLVQASRYKSEFLANMSHELRTPLNSILILSEQLKLNRSGNLNPKQISFADIILNSATDLLALINDILDLAKVEAGHMALNYEEFEVATLLNELERQFGILCQNKGISFCVVANQVAGQSLYTDRLRLGQVLRNLLSNALKFTSAGTITLEFKRMPSPVGVDGWAFTVYDSGIGIAPAMQAKVFDAFVQGDGSTNRRYGGSGLGLSISKQLAELLGGKLSLLSEVEKGSSFTLWLPHCNPAAVAQPIFMQPNRLVRNSPPLAARGV